MIKEKPNKAQKIMPQADGEATGMQLTSLTVVSKMEV